MWLKVALGLLGLPDFGLAADVARASKQTGVVKVYAYGTNISGLPVYAGQDGILPHFNPSLYSPSLYSICTCIREVCIGGRAELSLMRSRTGFSL